ncbi:MAG: SDR family NAD(P)-dependent oxidoreductase [Oscillospiraceae bacterium]
MGNELLNGKTALVTGANRGIGKAIALRFAEEGALVFAAARKEGSLDEMAQSSGGRIIPVYMDVTDTAAQRELFSRIKSDPGRLDVLVNNAGLTCNKLMGTFTRKDMEELFAVNVYAVIELMQIAAKFMRPKKSGSIINISSIVGQRGNAGQLLYSASKGAVISATKSAAKELAPFGIRVNSIAPGLTETDAIHLVDEKKLSKRIENIAMGRLASPEDIADACVFLGSDLSGYISGEIIGVNGCSAL